MPGLDTVLTCGTERARFRLKTHWIVAESEDWDWGLQDRIVPGASGFDVFRAWSVLLVVMKPAERLSTFDWVGVGLVTILGFFPGLIIAVPASDGGRPSLGLLILFPGSGVGMIVMRMFGITPGVVASGTVNGAAYGFLLYGWCRLAGGLRRRIPRWMGAAGAALAERLSSR
jgi:hypothetical protein